MGVPTNLLSLPQELLGEIAKLADSNGLLALGLTCKLLNTVTKSRSLWLRLVAEIQADACVPRTLERAVEDYTLQELRKWVLRRLRVRERLTCESTTTICSTREFQRDRRVQPVRFLPGGRWMICLDAICTRMYAYDLDSLDPDHPTQHQLFDVGKVDKKDGTLDLLSNSAIWIDPSQSGAISFRVLLWRIPRPEEDDHVTRTFIYQVDSFANKGTWILKAKRLAVFRSSDPVDRPAVAITDKYLVEVRRPDPKRLELKLYEYGVDTDGKGNKCNCKVVGPIPLADASSDPFEAHITSQNQVITLSADMINIYCIPQIQSDPPPKTLIPLQRVHLRLDITYFSGPFSFSGIPWIVVAHQNKLTLTKLDWTLPATQNMGKIEFIPREYMTRVGPRASVFLRHDWTLDLVTYSWDPETMKTVFKIRRVEGVGSECHHGKARSWFIWDFDLELGRIILFHTSTDRCILVDID